MSSTLAQQIFAANDRRATTVEVPEWGVEIELRSLSVRERQALLDQARALDDDADAAPIYARAIIACAYDPATGERVFTEGDMEALLDRSAAAVDRLAPAVMEVNGMTPEAVEAGKGASSSSGPTSATSSSSPNA